MKSFYFTFFILCAFSYQLIGQACCTGLNLNNSQNYCIANMDPCGVGTTCTGAALDAAFGITGNWAFGTACNMPANCSGCANISGGSMPVEMTEFEVSLQEKGIELFWVTATEINNEGFSIQRSRDGKNWEEVTFVSGHGDSEREHMYTFVDESPYLGFNYYRLKQMDFDGRSELTPVRVAIWQGSTDLDKLELAVLPNPATDWFTVALPSGLFNESQLDLRIYNQTGQLLKVWSWDGASEIRVPIDELTAGLYVLSIEKGSNRYTARFVKK